MALYSITFSPLGGLWETGVISVKFHFKRVLGNNRLTYEQFYSLLTQIQTIVISRGNGNPPCPSDLVLLREDRLPPLKWQLARVSSVHPGKDGVIRVVSLKLPG